MYQNAGEAADYLLAPSEDQAHQVWTDQSTEGANTRYVMVDSQMASPNSKFNAPVTFYSGNETTSDFNRVIHQQQQNGGFGRVMQAHTKRYHESQMIQRFENVSTAREYVVDDGSAQVSDLGRLPSERVDTLIVISLNSFTDGVE